MSAPLDLSAKLDDCGCCEGASHETPAPVFNRPGLSALAYRIGTHAQFKQTMLARLSASRGAATQGLNTRDDDDFSIGLIDAWASVADVLTFYQERIANESYLRTATERLSVLELARLIGYQLRPGVAANAHLAFTLDEAPGAFGQAIAQNAVEPPPPVTIEAGVKVQSVPGPGEQAQTFETIEPIEARVEWNAILPRLTQPQKLSKTMGTLVLRGATANLKTGDKLLIDAPDGDAVRTVVKSSVDNATTGVEQTTRIDFENPGLSPATYERPSNLAQGKSADFPAQSALETNTIEAITAKWWTEEDLAALAQMQNWPIASLVAAIDKTANPVAGNGVFVFRQRAALFGHNAPRQPAYDKNGTPLPFTQWPEWDPGKEEAADTVFLDAPYDAVVAGSRLAIQKPGAQPSVYKLAQALTRSRADYGMSAKVTVLKLAGGAKWWIPNTEKFEVIRGTAVYAQSEPLELAAVPITDIVSGDTLTLDRAYLGLKKGQKIILTGERADLKGVTAAELLTVSQVIIEAGFTVLTFETAIANEYLRHTVRLNANVARATHGETVQETLGGGNASQTFQRFTLRQPPLTYVSAASASGGRSTLEVRVNDLAWREVPELFGHAAERVYVTRTGDDGETTLIFGDGETGARLPTGPDNVRAKYRKGVGLGGLVKAQQLSQLVTRPLGVRGVTNPLPAEGAQDSEQLKDARRNAPLTLLTLGRVVSLQDYEDFARAFSGIAKALATWSWSGEQRSVLLTVAGRNGALVRSDLAKNLLAALHEFGDPKVPLLIASFEPRFFRLAATIRIAPDELTEKVRAEVEARLREQFSFEAREFGQPVHLSEVIGVIHGVPGALAVTVREFYRSDETPGAEPAPRLAAARPRLQKGKLLGAELLTLDPRPLSLEMTLSA